MIRINLLPHREARRKELKNQFLSMMLLSAVLAAGVIVVGGLYFSWQVSAQESRNTILKNENEKLDLKIKDVAALKQEIDALKARQQAVEDLQADRNQPVFMMNELIRLAPEGLYLTVIKQEGQHIAIKGYAQSHQLVGDFNKALNASIWMSHAEIVQSKAILLEHGRESRRAMEFDLDVGIRRPREVEAETENGKADTNKDQALTPPAAVK